MEKLAELEYSEELTELMEKRVEEILRYYQKRQEFTRKTRTPGFTGSIKLTRSRRKKNRSDKNTGLFPQWQQE